MTENASTPRTVRTACPLDCPDHCSLEVSVLDGRTVRIDGSDAKPATEGLICGKVRTGLARRLEHESRLRSPLVRVEGARKGEARFREVSWDEALERVARAIRQTQRRSGGEAILPVFYGGSNGRFTQGAADEVLFRRLGASRLHRNVCAVPTGMAARAMYGGMQGVAPADFVHARLVCVWGTNPHASGIHLVPAIQRARAAGAALVVVDPRRTKLARQADLHLQPRPGTDLPLALSVLRWLFREGRADRGFLERHATGVEELEERADMWTFERAAEACEIPAGEIEAFARLWAESDPAVVRCGWGPERNRNGGSAICSILALPAVAGKFGVRGGGYVMSNSSVYGLEPIVSEPPPPTRTVPLSRLGRALLEEERPPIELVFVYNANPVATLPDQERVLRGFSRGGLFTVVFDQVLTDTARYADVVLPATTFLEHWELSAAYGDPSVQLGPPALEAREGARPNYEVFAELLRRLDLERPQDDFTPEGMLRAAVPDPEARERLRQGAVLGSVNGSRPVQFVDVFPGTPDGKVHLLPKPLDAAAPRGLYSYQEDPADRSFPLALISPATEKRVSSTFGELFGGEVPVVLHPDDAAERELEEGDPVRVFNPLGEVVTRLALDAGLKRGVAVLPKGLWLANTRNRRTANALVPDSFADVGQAACYNDARVQVGRA